MPQGAGRRTQDAGRGTQDAGRQSLAGILPAMSRSLLRSSLPLILVLGSFSLLVSAQAPPPAASDAAEPLPVRRVVLYKTGVGYFEHRGTVRGAQAITIRFTSAQLNDVLKSLTAIDLGKGQVTGISYNSVAPVEQRLEALRLPLGPRSTRMSAGAAASSGVGPASIRKILDHLALPDPAAVRRLIEEPVPVPKRGADDLDILRLAAPGAKQARHPNLVARLLAPSDQGGYASMFRIAQHSRSLSEKGEASVNERGSYR